MPKPEGHPPDSAAKPDVNLSIHPAPQQCSGFHSHNYEQGHDNDDAVNSNCPDGNYLDFCRGGEPPISRQGRKASHNRHIVGSGLLMSRSYLNQLYRSSIREGIVLFKDNFL